MLLKLNFFSVLFCILIYKAIAFPEAEISGNKIRLRRAVAQVENLKNRQCRIRNVHQNEFLYAADNYFNYDANRRTILTWRHKNQKVTKGIWEFQPTGEDSVFKIKNKKFNEYLYAANDAIKYDSDRRRVFTWKAIFVFNNATEFNWLVIHRGGSHFTLRNQETKDYLYAASDRFALDKDRRRVFNWAPRKRTPEAVWEFQC